MPRISIVIPTLRRHELLSRVLDRLEAQRGVDPQAFEVVVVADAAEEDPAGVDRAIGERPFPTRRLTGPEPGVAATRDHGWREASCDLILFLGDDMLPQPDLVAEHLAWQERHPEEEVGVLGHVRWARERRVTPFMRWLDYHMQFDYPTIEAVGPSWTHFYACNCSLKRGLLERAGGFDHEFRFGYEEMELARRMRDLGFGLVYNPGAVVEHLHPATLESWRERMRSVAAAELQFIRKHPDAQPYFHSWFSRVAAERRPRGRGARLVGIVPRWGPWLGTRVWASADAYWRRELADAFLAAWTHAETAAGGHRVAAPRPNG